MAPLVLNMTALQYPWRRLHQKPQGLGSPSLQKYVLREETDTADFRVRACPNQVTDDEASLDRDALPL